MNIEFVPVGTLRANPNNARTHSARQIRKIAKSVKAFGFNSPILTDDNYLVIAGHGRLEAAKQLKIATVPVVRLSHMSKEQVRAYMLADNKLALEEPWRVPAPDIEAAVIGEIQRFLGDRQRIAGALKRSRLQAHELRETLRTANDLCAQLDAFASRRETAPNLIKRAVVSDSKLVVELMLGTLISDASEPARTATHRLTIPIELGRQGGSAIMLASASDRGAAADPALVKALARGFAWFEELATGRADTVTAIAKRERVTDRYVSQLVELAFIEPRIVQRALAGFGRTGISTTRLVFKADLPRMWSDQRDVIFASSQ